MKAIRSNSKRRDCRRFRIRREQFSLPLILMTLGYLLGCVIGIFVAINADVKWIGNLPSNLVDEQSSGLFTVFCSCSAYGLGMLFLATSYLGFLFIPGVLSLKGFLSASVFTACIRSDCPHCLERACVGLLLPGIFLLPALLMLGQRCMHCSVRQLRFRAGEMVPPDSAAPGALGAVLVLLLMASAVKAYVVPYVLNLL